MTMSEDSDINVRISKSDIDLWTAGLGVSRDGVDIPLFLNFLDIFVQSILVFLRLLQ